MVPEKDTPFGSNSLSSDKGRSPLVKGGRATVTHSHRRSRSDTKVEVSYPAAKATPRTGRSPSMDAESSRKPMQYQQPTVETDAEGSRSSSIRGLPKSHPTSTSRPPTNPPSSSKAREIRSPKDAKANARLEEKLKDTRRHPSHAAVDSGRVRRAGGRLGGQVGRAAEVEESSDSDYRLLAANRAAAHSPKPTLRRTAHILDNRKPQSASRGTARHRNPRSPSRRTAQDRNLRSPSRNRAQTPEDRNSPPPSHHPQRRARSDAVPDAKGPRTPSSHRYHRRCSTHSASYDARGGKTFADMVAEGPRTAAMMSSPGGPPPMWGAPALVDDSLSPPPPPPPPPAPALIQWGTGQYPSQHPYQPIHGGGCWCTHTPCCPIAHTGHNLIETPYLTPAYPLPSFRYSFSQPPPNSQHVPHAPAPSTPHGGYPYGAKENLAYSSQPHGGEYPDRVTADPTIAHLYKPTTENLEALDMANRSSGTYSKRRVTE